MWIICVCVLCVCLCVHMTSSVAQCDVLFMYLLIMVLMHNHMSNFLAISGILYTYRRVRIINCCHYDILIFGKLCIITKIQLIGIGAIKKIYILLKIWIVWTIYTTCIYTFFSNFLSLICYHFWNNMHCKIYISAHPRTQLMKIIF